MTRRGSAPDAAPPPERERDSDGAGLDARVRVRPRDLHQMIRTAYSVAAIVLWAALPIGAAKLLPPMISAAVHLTDAMTRVSVAIERAGEGTARIEARAERIEGKIDRLAETCARCDGRR